MGISVNGARFLVYAKSLGVDFTSTATIGRQGLYVTRSEMLRVLQSFGHKVDETGIVRICEGAGGFSETFLKYLGAEEVHSFDYSDYESATHTCDMNDAIPKKFEEQYTVVLDSGSLEHVFNFPVAIKNCMKMVKVGGHYLAVTPANNFFGHGFYQFSPELFFTVFSKENGFDLERMIAFEEKAKPVWYFVKSPREVSGRVTLSNSFPVYLLIIAKRVADLPIFETTPQQSDYTVIWSANAKLTADSFPAAAESIPAVPARRPLPIRIAKKLLPFVVRRLIRKLLERPAPPPRGFDARFFQRMDPRFDNHI